jgi:pimeloyl-ACP methyl ester carboxylesterase
LIYLALEGRAVLELAGAALALPWLRSLPRGDGHTVLVLPGYGTTDTWTVPLRRFLTHLGYRADGWELGRNFGLTRGRKQALLERIEQIHERDGQQVSLVGWSLGGSIARELARAAPDPIRSVITLGSPFSGDPRATNVSRIRRLFSKEKPVDWAGFERRKKAPPVPTTAIHSRSDGVVNWRCSLEDPSPTTENVRVRGSHLGLTVNRKVLAVIADRLARPAAAR